MKFEIYAVLWNFAGVSFFDVYLFNSGTIFLANFCQN